MAKMCREKRRKRGGKQKGAKRKKGRVKTSQFNSVQTRCIVEGEAQKSPLFWRFSGGF